MTALVRTQRMVAVFGGAVAVVLALTGCAPQLSSPVGTWRAAGEDEGTLLVNADGTFEADHVSYDFVHDRDAEADFSASGTWRLVRDGTEIKLHVVEASRGGLDIEPVSFSVGFSTGVMRFHDAEEIVGIEFRLEDPDE